MHEPHCAFGCQNIPQSSKLNCSTPSVADRWHGGSGLGFGTSGECYASDTAYLQSLAYCLYDHCHEPTFELSRFSATEIAGSDHNLVHDYEEVLRLGSGGPPKELVLCEPLEQPGTAPDADLRTIAMSMDDFAATETQGSKNALIVFFIILLAPILLTAAEWVLFVLSVQLKRWFLVHFIYP
jgi:hypothetical protein